jgi:ubiquinol-cytochrome c reductase cytochrome c subunit
MRNILKGRYAVPAALLTCVGIFGLIAFTPATAQATAPLYSSSSSYPSHLQNPTPSDGIANVDLPGSLIAPGEALFSASCASCHGADAKGSYRAPPIDELGAGTVDFWVSTGRMPLADSNVQATRKAPRFDRLQTLEIASFVQSLNPSSGIAVPSVNLAGSDLENGNSLFTLNCAACHTITGAGDALAGGAYAPGLHLATTTQVIEAIRSGPGNMPHFSQGNLSNGEARDIAAYVNGVIQHPVDRGGFGLGGIGPVGEGFVSLLIGVGSLMLVCFWIGERT